MASVPDVIFAFFEKNFKKRLTLFVSIPLIFSAIYVVDFYVLPDSVEMSLITQVFEIKVSTSAGGTRVRMNKKIGYKYITDNKLKFSTQGKNIGFSEIQVTYSPVFNTVKSVIFNNKQLKISSGFNGISKVILLACNFTILISLIYIFLARKTTENARLNLVFVNILMLLLWFYTIVKFGI